MMTAHDRVVGVSVKSSMAREFGVAISVNDADQLAEGGALVLHNHTSPLDTFIIALALKGARGLDPVVIVPAEFDDEPLLRSLQKRGAIEVERIRTHGAVDLGQTEDLVVHMLDLGRPVLVATRLSADASTGHLGVDDALVALAATVHATVQPAATFGAHRRFDGTSVHSKPAQVQATVTFGSPVDMERRTSVQTATTILHADVEHLMGRTLASYPDRQRGPGSWWWPEGLDPAPRNAPTARPVTLPEDGPTEPDPDDPWEKAKRGLAGPGGDLGDAWRTYDRGPASPVATQIWDAVVADGHIVVDPDTLPELPDLDEVKALLPPPPPRRPGGRARGHVFIPEDAEEEQVANEVVSGVLSFHFPGKPMQTLRQAELHRLGEDRLRIVSRRSTATLAALRQTTHDDQQVLVGELEDDYLIQSGGVQLTLPTGTRVAFMPVRAVEDDTNGV